MIEGMMQMERLVMENLDNVGGSTPASGASSTQEGQKGPGPVQGGEGETFGGAGGWDKFKKEYPDVAKSMEENMAWTTIREQEKSEERQKKMRQESERQS
jgi:hypothetical protein